MVASNLEKKGLFEDAIEVYDLAGVSFLVKVLFGMRFLLSLFIIEKQTLVFVLEP